MSFFFPFPALKNHSLATARFNSPKAFALSCLEKEKNKPTIMTLLGWIPKIPGFQNGKSIIS